MALITGQGISLKELSGKIGVYEEDLEVFEAFIEFIITSCRYNLQIRRKIVQEIGNTDDFLEFAELHYNEIISPIKNTLESSIMSMIRAGAINAKRLQNKGKLSNVKGLFGTIFKNIGGDSSSDPLSLHHANSALSKEEISDICDLKVEEVILAF